MNKVPNFFPQLDTNNQCSHCKCSLNALKPEEVKQHLIQCLKSMIKTPYITGGM